jgi:hypothetical protein
MSDPVIGDGVITLPPSGEEEIMDLPTNVGTMIITESSGNIQANNRDGRNLGTAAMGVLQGAMARRHDEVGTLEGRAVSGVNATPVGPPSPQA